MKKELIDIYSDYLISSFSYTTATGLSKALNGEITHDKITQFLSKEDMDSKKLWHLTKKTIRENEEEDGVIIFDDTIEEKPHTKESELICWHYDHSKGHTVKGINMLNCVYGTNKVTLPLGFDLVRKPIEYRKADTQKMTRMSGITKNEMMRARLKVCQENRIIYKYVLTDSWFSSKENMTYIHKDLKKDFIMALKTNRTVALSETDKSRKSFIRINTLDWTDQSPKRCWLKGVDFAVLIYRQVFKNKDGSEGILYLACSDLNCKATEIETIYQKRWKVEVYHKTLKSNVGLAKSPTKCIRTQSNHVFMSVYAAFQLECLHLKHKIGHFALRAKLYIKALQQAMAELDFLKSA